jgi:hypothetical protein
MLVDGLVRKNSEKWQWVAGFRMVYCHFKMHLYDVKPVFKTGYEASVAPARVAFGRGTAISVRTHASEIERRRRLRARARGIAGLKKWHLGGTKWHLFGRSSSPISRPRRDFGPTPDAVGALVGTHCRKPALPLDPSTLSWMDQSSQSNVIMSLSLCPSFPRPRGRDKGTNGQQGQESGR